MLNSIENIIDLHENKGRIEDGYVNIHFDDKILKLNTFTLRFTTVNGDREETKRLNNRIDFEIRKNRNLYKEIKEFRILFEALNKLKVKSGYLQKSESPDFIIEKDNIKTGIEITKIYSGNDWAAEKIYEDIRTYAIEDKEVEGYIEYRKFTNKIKTYQIKENLVIKPLNQNEDIDTLKAKLKNKIFEKVRKLYDDYKTYDKNIILANIVSPEYLENADNIEKLNEEITFYLNHLEVGVNDKEYFLLLRLKKDWMKFDLKKHECEML